MTGTGLDLAQQNITQLRGVGPKLAERLQRLDIRSVQDLLFHLPSHYQDRTRLTPIADLKAAQEALFEGAITASRIAMGRRRSLQCQLQDATGTVTLRFFHFNAQQQRHLSSGSRLRCFGEVRRGSAGLEVYHPEYQALDGCQDLAMTLTPCYPSTEGIGQATWRRLMTQALTAARADPPSEWLAPIAGSDPLLLLEALNYLHSPPPAANLGQLQQGQHPAQQRLALEELVAHQLGLLTLRRSARANRAPRLPVNAKARTALLTQLGFPLTSAQERVTAEISRDLADHRPMLRLLQGDVGSGKTLVAALAALQAATASYQVALMAPTDILSEQLWARLSAWFEPLDVSVTLLSGRLKGSARNRALQGIASGETAVAIGTHALFQDTVQFRRLGLVIVDEQHRFGVHQRLSLRDKGVHDDSRPHQLTMTATPIPRTLAMTAYADLDCSIIDELPPGRSPVLTAAIPNGRRAEVIARIRAAAKAGQQAYWVCTLIEESELLQAQAAQAMAAELAASLPELNVGLVHGRLKSDQKATVMRRFALGEIAILVATTVIEVGVDIPNASLMVIENPERLGLAQLHQLRGRVGRGSIQSHCVLLYQAPLSRAGTARLQAMRDSCDGFYLAERDLELRGPGELLGSRQTGQLILRIADLARDQHLIEEARKLALLLLEQQPEGVDGLLARWLTQRGELAQA